MSSEISQHADFSEIRYAQCWEDADILLQALRIQPGDTCLSIASAGDNTLAMLSCSPAKVIALDLSHAQLACLELRVAAYRSLQHHELLELIGSVASTQRLSLYRRCRDALPTWCVEFWDTRPNDIQNGIGTIGKFEHYFELFRKRVLPLVHRRKRISELLEAKSVVQRERFYQHTWNNWRWRLLFRIFFSRRVMGSKGRDPRFFHYVEGSVAERILQRTRYALTQLDPSQNPYLQWILLGQHQQALPYALREEHFESIRNNLDKLTLHPMSIEDYLAKHPQERIDCFNLSDIFEYMSEENFHRLLDIIIQHSNPEARLAYWNMLVPRSRPQGLSDRLHANETLASELFSQDKAFFYSRFIVEEVSQQ